MKWARSTEKKWRRALFGGAGLRLAQWLLTPDGDANQGVVFRVGLVCCDNQRAAPRTRLDIGAMLGDRPDDVTIAKRRSKPCSRSR